MSIQDLIILVERKIVNLTTLYTSAENIGDIERMLVLQEEINSSGLTLEKLKTV